MLNGCGGLPGLILFTGEMLVPGVYLLWLGVAAALTGVVVLLVADMGFALQALIFCLFGAPSIYIANRYFYRDKEEPEQLVNVRGQNHVGKTCTVVVAFESWSRQGQYGGRAVACQRA